MTDKRADLLIQTARAFIQAAGAGAFGGRSIQILRAETVAGPRAGAVALYAGLETGRLYRALAADDAAAARQFIAWPFVSEPTVYLAGRAVRVEAGWPRELARDTIRLRSVARRPQGDGRWVAGVNERGQTVIAALDDQTPHFLYGGTTGSGKTVGLLSAGLQLSQDPNTRLVLIDGKMGAGLGPLVNLPGTVGPLATEVSTARDALGWVNDELRRRYRVIAAQGEVAVRSFPRIVVIFDEFQEFTGDPCIVELLRRVLSKGRAARIHALLATQHPTVAAFGADGSLKRNLVGRMALKVLDAKASEVVVGAPVPRADRLLGAGDAYAIGASAIHRTQLVLVERQDLERAERHPPILEEWPPFHPEDAGQEPNARWSYTGAELAHGLAAARRGWGRDRLRDALDGAGLGRPGSVRADRLLRLCREQLEVLGELGFGLEEAPVHLVEARGARPGEIIDVYV